ncbi:MAG: hypothetical protein IJ960_07565 [Oscillospiraceae bacterium]|nr:hypothetical protein [Oscillospiraceae bacterium]
MKKIALVLALVLSMSCLAACGSTAPETTAPAAPAVTAPAGTTAELIDSIYANVTVELGLVTETTEGALADAEMFTYLTTLPSMEGIVDAAVSMPMMGSQAYHLALVRAESAEKAAEAAQFMFDNMDMARWVCVQATEKQAVVCGDLALFIMLDPQHGTTSDQIVEAFTTVCGGAVDTVIK